MGVGLLHQLAVLNGGKAKACGGDAMMRIEAYQKAGGFNTTLICGEEPELCIRIRQAGYTIDRRDAEMTLHDAKMTKFSQFWKRSVRGGWAYAEGSAMHQHARGHDARSDDERTGDRDAEASSHPRQGAWFVQSVTRPTRSNGG